jgi:hypothetical protein
VPFGRPEHGSSAEGLEGQKGHGEKEGNPEEVNQGDWEKEQTAKHSTDKPTEGSTRASNQSRPHHIRLPTFDCRATRRTNAERDRFHLNVLAPHPMPRFWS